MSHLRKYGVNGTIVKLRDTDFGVMKLTTGTVNWINGKRKKTKKNKTDERNFYKQWEKWSIYTFRGRDHQKNFPF